MAIGKKDYRKMRYDDKKNGILESAARVFAKKGFEKANLEEIADALKMTKGSLYYYITSKEDMLFQCILKALRIANEMLIEVRKTDLPPETKLRLAIMGHIKVLTKDFVLGTIRQQELLLPQKMRDKVVEERDRFEKIFLKMVKDAIVDKNADKNILKMKTYAMLGALNWIPRWYSPGKKLSPEEIGNIMADYLIKGL